MWMSRRGFCNIFGHAHMIYIGIYEKVMHVNRESDSQLLVSEEKAYPRSGQLREVSLNSSENNQLSKRFILVTVCDSLVL